jgi:hypothetical protein
MSKPTRHRSKLEAALKKLNDVALDIEAVTTEIELSEAEADVLSTSVDALVRKVKAAVRKSPEKFEIEWGDDDSSNKQRSKEKDVVVKDEKITPAKDVHNTSGNNHL